MSNLLMIPCKMNKLVCFGITCLIISVILGANSTLASGQSPPPQNQLQTLSCPHGYYLATNYLCYPLQPRPTNVTQSPPLFNSTASTNFGHPTIIINEVKPGLPTLPYITISDDNHALVGNIVFYINPADGDYHIKGVKRNVLPETTDISSVMIFLHDQASGKLIASASDSSPSTDLAPGGTQNFDIDTGYNVTRAAKEFKYMYGHIIGP